MLKCSPLDAQPTWILKRVCAVSGVLHGGDPRTLREVLEADAVLPTLRSLWGGSRKGKKLNGRSGHHGQPTIGRAFHYDPPTPPETRGEGVARNE